MTKRDKWPNYKTFKDLLDTFPCKGLQTGWVWVSIIYMWTSTTESSIQGQAWSNQFTVQTVIPRTQNNFRCRKITRNKKI
jgi:hypothetical protein